MRNVKAHGLGIEMHAEIHHVIVIVHETSSLPLSFQMDDEPFNPDYVEVDRVLDVSESTDENREVL